MTTSSTYTVTRSAYKIVKAISRLVAAEKSPDPDEIDIIIDAINDWLLQVQEPINDLMWQRETADITLSAKVLYSLKPSGGDCDIQIPLEILTANLKNTDGDETPIKLIDIYEYQAIANKSSTATPSMAYYERRPSVGYLYLDAKPSDTTDVLDIVYRQPLELITAVTQTFDLENHFYRYLKYAVAVDVAPEFRTESDVFSKLIMLRDEAAALVATVNPDNSTDYFQPDVDE